MLSRIVALALVASVALLAGCTHETVGPRPPTDTEFQAFMKQQNDGWWHSMFPNEDPPVVAVVKYLDPSEGSTLVTDCILAANIPGVVDDNGNFVGYNASDPATNDLFNRTMYTCQLQYPYQPSSATEMGVMSTVQLEYLYSYFTQRLVPCLELMGYGVGSPPSHDSFLYSAPYIAWTPYQVMDPQVTTGAQWARVDARCPPPTVGKFWRQGLDY